MKVHETGDFFNERFTKGVFFRQNGIQKDKRLDLELVAELPRIELNRVPPVLTTTATKSPW